MIYISLGNMKRFLNKLKDYLSNNYLQLSGGTVTGDTIFRKKISAHEVCLAGLSDVSLINKDNGSIAKDGLTILDEGNYNLFTPTLHGTGATGTWDINISGNATHDSDGNKITDTYAKKSEVGSTPDLTPYMKKKADDNLTMGGNSIFFPGATITSRPVNGVGSLYINAKGSKGVFVDGYIMMNNATVATEDFVRTSVPTKTSQLTNDSGFAAISNGHLVINGSELWIE